MKKLLPLILLAASIHVFGQVPGTISYQGILTDGNGDPVPDGNHEIVFKFYSDPTIGTPLVLGSQTLEYGPFIIQTFRGLFSFVIGGGGSNNPPLPAALGNQEVWLGVTPDGEAEMTPRIRLTSVPYSFRANVADQVSNIDASTISSGILDNARLDNDLQDLADGSLTGTKIGAGIDATNITTGTLSSARLDTDLQDLADGSLTGSKVGTGISAGNITTGTLPDARLSPHLQDLADGQLSGTKIDITAGSNITLTPSGSSIQVSSPTDVRSINGLDGIIDIEAGTNITIETTANQLTINSSSPSGTGATGQIPYWTGTSSLGSVPVFTWDNTDYQLGIGTSVPSQKLEIIVPSGDVSTMGILIQNNSDNLVGNKTGVHIDVNDRGPSARYGINSIVSRGAGNNNLMVGIQSQINSSASTGSSTGVASNVNNGSSAESYAFFANSTGLGSGAKYGIYTQGEAYNRLGGNLLLGAGATTTYRLQVNGDTYLNGIPYSTQASFTVLSDKRTKRDISSFSDGLATLLELRPVRFKYNGLGGSLDDGREHIGIIAQEVQAVAPYMVKTESRKLHENDQFEAEMLTFNGSSLPFIVINAVQEQQKQIESLKEEIAKLKALVSELSTTRSVESGQVASSERK